MLSSYNINTMRYKMINENLAKRYCKEDISKIKNYDKAIADTTQTWDCHHMTETWWNCSRKELIENECYYNRKACELIFLTKEEHQRLHKKGKHLSEEHRRKIGKAHKGKKIKPFTEEHRKKISASLNGHQHSKESIKKMSAAFKGKTWKIIDGKRVWISKEGK